MLRLLNLNACFRKECAEMNKRNKVVAIFADEIRKWLIELKLHPFWHKVLQQSQD